ncbi:MAG: hypothetical protein JSS02_06955 [Planctomycetes bacterium]|nr:hypothetical protein [Planctomycetota bacterium]
MLQIELLCSGPDLLCSGSDLCRSRGFVLQHSSQLCGSLCPQVLCSEVLQAQVPPREVLQSEVLQAQVLQARLQRSGPQLLRPGCCSDLCRSLCTGQLRCSRCDGLQLSCSSQSLSLKVLKCV